MVRPTLKDLKPVTGREQNGPQKTNWSAAMATTVVAQK